VAINAEERAIDARYPDINRDADEDPIDGPRLRANGIELLQIKARIVDLTITAMAGAAAAGRAAMPESRKEQEEPGIEAQPTDLYELLALKLVEYHAGMAAFTAGMHDGSVLQPLLAIEELPSWKRSGRRRQPRAVWLM
jgi:hypothetical protein